MRRDRLNVSVTATALTLFLIGGLIAHASPDSGQGAAEPPVSPRLAALQKRIEAGERDALAAFWQDVAKQGAPLTEPVPDKDKFVWLTFLWRGTDETKNVVIWSDLGNAQDLKTLQMTRLPGTDLWYKTYQVRNDARFAYRLSVNDSLLPFGSVARGQQPEAFQVDPLNPRRFDLLKPRIYSVVELPAAPSLDLTKRVADVPRSQGGRLNFPSTILNNSHRVWVYTPPGYKPDGGPYPLVILFDGSGYVTLIPAPVVLDNLLAKGRIPPTVAVLVDSGGGPAREAELMCNPKFAEFLTKELLPWVRQHYRVTDDPKRTIVGGASAGGLAAAYVAFKHPELFGNVLSQSGSFWWKPDADAEYEWLTRQFVHSPRLPLKFYLQAGLLENLSTARPDSPTLLTANRHFRDVLQAKGYAVEFQEINGGHDFFAWQATLPDGLSALLGESNRK